MTAAVGVRRRRQQGRGDSHRRRCRGSAAPSLLVTVTCFRATGGRERAGALERASTGRARMKQRTLLCFTCRYDSTWLARARDGGRRVIRAAHAAPRDSAANLRRDDDDAAAVSRNNQDGRCLPRTLPQIIDIDISLPALSLHPHFLCTPRIHSSSIPIPYCLRRRHPTTPP